jgi:predicted DNA-binding transcriptional regulator AlpA
VNESGKIPGMKAVRGKLLTVKEVSSFLRVSERWIQAHMVDGSFPLRWYPIGERDRLVDSADLDDWLLKIRVPAGTRPVPKKSEKEVADVC